MKFLLAAALAVALAGCASGPAPRQDAEQLRATHGFVRVTLPLASPGSRLMLRSLGDRREHPLPQDESLGRAVFGAWLPAGEYEIAGLYRQDGGPYQPLTVSAGQMTELGGLIPVAVGGYEVITVPIRHSEIAEDAARTIDRLAPHLRNRKPVEWAPDAVPQATRMAAPSTNLGLVADLLMAYERHANKPPLSQQLKRQTSASGLYRMALLGIPPQTDDPAVDDKGTLYFGAALGQVRVRAPDGRWGTIDTGTLDSITAVATSGRKLAAGTWHGALRTSEDGGLHWTRGVSVNGGETVLDIDRIGSRWFVLTARLKRLPHLPGTHETGRLSVYTSTRDDLSDLSLLRQFDAAGGQPLPLHFLPKGHVSGGLYLVNGAEELPRFDTATMQWSDVKLPHRASTLHVSSEARVLTATYNMGAFSKLHVSTDDGVTWMRRDTPSYPIYDVRFDSPAQGLATRWNMGAFSSTLEFMRYDAAQDRWQRTHEAPPGCVRVLRDAAHVQRYCLTSGGSILSHTGADWAVEFAAD